MKEIKFCVEKNPSMYRHISSDEYEFTFSSPQQYWEFQKEWADNYNELSREIRAMKRERSRENGGYVSGLLEAQGEARHEMSRRALAREAGKAKRAQASEARTVEA